MTMKTKELIKRARRAEVAEPGVIVRTPPLRPAEL